MMIPMMTGQKYLVYPEAAKEDLHSLLPDDKLGHFVDDTENPCC